MLAARRRLSRRHLRRYREIVQAFMRHGFGAVVGRFGIAARLGLREPLEQATDQRAAAEHLRLALEELGPTFVKIGQLLSTRPDLLPKPFIDQLQLLQDSAPPLPWSVARSVLETELGESLDELFAEVETEPVASASLGQVHRAWLPAPAPAAGGATPPGGAAGAPAGSAAAPSGAGAAHADAASTVRGDAVVIKIQRPGVPRMVRVDLDIVFDIARWLGQRPDVIGFLDPVAIAEEFSDALTGELDYELEARNLQRFRRAFAGDAEIHVPEVVWGLTTPRVLVMERIEGIKVNEVELLDAAGADRHAAAIAIARMYLKSIFEHHVFHADPHPGNLWVLPGDRIGILDFGRVHVVAPKDEERLTDLVGEVLTGDAERATDRLLALDIAPGGVHRAGLERDIGRILANYLDRPLGQIHLADLLDEILRIALRHRLRLPSSWVVLLHATVMLEGVLLRLDPGLNLFAVARPYFVRLKLRRVLPTQWGPGLARSAQDWLALAERFPRYAERLLQQAERGGLSIEFRSPEIDRAARSLDRAANRVAIGVMASSLIMAIALILPLLDFTPPWSIATWLGVVGFSAATVLAVWLLVTILRSGRI